MNSQELTYLPTEAAAETEPDTVKVTPTLISKMVHDTVERQFADAETKARITDGDAVAILDKAFAAAHARRQQMKTNHHPR